MKRILTLILILFASVVFANNPRVIESDSEIENYRAYQTANRELRELGFQLSEVKEGRYFIMDRLVLGKLYQVHVKKRKKSIIVDIYAFVNAPYRKRYSEFGENFGQEVGEDLLRAIKHRIEYGSPLPKISLPSFWSEIRNKNVEIYEGL